jgi:hypothetical protein
VSGAIRRNQKNEKTGVIGNCKRGNREWEDLKPAARAAMDSFARLTGDG